MTTPEARGPLAVVRIYHDEIYSLVKDEAEVPVEHTVVQDDGTEKTVRTTVEVGGEVYDSLGEYKPAHDMSGEDQESPRFKIQQTVIGGYTEVEISPDFNPDNQIEWAHQAAFLLDRHAPGEHITGLFCRDGDKKIAKRLAAFMGVDYLTTEPEAPAETQEG